MAKPAAAKKPRTARKRVKEEYGSYIVEVSDWETSYSFKVNRDDRFYTGSYGEHLHLEIKGVLRYPFNPDFPLAFLVVYDDQTGGPVAFAHSPTNHARFRLGTDSKRRSSPWLPCHLPPIASTRPCSVDSVC